MSSPRKNKMLLILVVILLLTNAAMLYYLVGDYREDKKSKTQKQVEWVRKELKLDDGQFNQYLASRNKRDSIIVPINDVIRSAKMQMLSYLKQPSSAGNDSLVANTATEITTAQKGIEIAFHQHFRRLRTICRPDQVPLLDSLLVQMVNRTTNKPGGKENR